MLDMEENKPSVMKYQHSMCHHEESGFHETLFCVLSIVQKVSHFGNWVILQLSEWESLADRSKRKKTLFPDNEKQHRAVLTISYVFPYTIVPHACSCWRWSSAGCESIVLALGFSSFPYLFLASH